MDSIEKRLKLAAQHGGLKKVICHAGFPALVIPGNRTPGNRRAHACVRVDWTNRESECEILHVEDSKVEIWLNTVYEHPRDSQKAFDAFYGDGTINLLMDERGVVRGIYLWNHKIDWDEENCLELPIDLTSCWKEEANETPKKD